MVFSNINNITSFSCLQYYSDLPPILPKIKFKLPMSAYIIRLLTFWFQLTSHPAPYKHLLQTSLVFFCFSCKLRSFLTSGSLLLPPSGTLSAGFSQGWFFLILQVLSTTITLSERYFFTILYKIVSIRKLLSISARARIILI